MSTLTTAPMTLHFCPWPEGAEVGAYLRISETMVFESTPPGQIPAEEVFVAEGQVTFHTLPVGDYWAVGQMPDGRFRYVSFRQQPDPPGMQGPPGPTGPQGIQGAGAVVWKGPWSAAASYVLGDAVAQGQASWVAKRSNLNKQPNANPADWDLMADKGATGDPGPGVALGGQTGQVLTKNSPTNLDASWKTLTRPTEIALPASPAVGDEIYLLLPGGGAPDYVYWHLRYETQFFTRWDFLGGAPKRFLDDAGDLVINSATPVPDADLLMELPAKGVYEVHYQAARWYSAGGSALDVNLRVAWMLSGGAYESVTTLERPSIDQSWISSDLSKSPVYLNGYADLRNATGKMNPPQIAPLYTRTAGTVACTVNPRRTMFVRPVYLIP